MDLIDRGRCNNVPIGDEDIFNVRKMIVRGLCSQLPKGASHTFMLIDPDEEPAECAECVCIVFATNNSEEKRNRAYIEELLKTFRDVIIVARPRVRMGRAPGRLWKSQFERIISITSL